MIHSVRTALLSLIAALSPFICLAVTDSTVVISHGKPLDLPMAERISRFRDAGWSDLSPADHS